MKYVSSITDCQVFGAKIVIEANGSAVSIQDVCYMLLLNSPDVDDHTQDWLSGYIIYCQLLLLLSDPIP